MRTKKISFIPFLGLDLIIIFFSIFGIYRIYIKADLPLKFNSNDSYLVVRENNFSKLNLIPGDTLISINSFDFNSQDEIEVYLDGFKPGDLIQVNYLKNGNEFSTSIRLIRFYSDFYIIIASITGLLLILIGTFIFWKKQDDKAAKLFYFVDLATASIIMMTWGNYNVPLAVIDFMVNIIFLFSYSLAPALFVHFTLNFPRKKNARPIVIYLIYIFALIVSTSNSIYCFGALSSRTPQAIQLYIGIYEYSRLYSSLCIISGLVIFIHSYVTSNSLVERKKLRWILLGFILGPLMYACLWVIPQGLTNYGLIPEEYVVMLMLLIPVTFAIAIQKHHIFDIDLIIERSLIYFLSIGTLIFIYAFVISIITHFIENINEYLSSGVAAVIIALLFHPAKEKIQKIIDKRFFRIRYDFRIASRKFLEEIKNFNDIQSLAEKIISQIRVLIPVKKQAFFSFSKSNSRIYLMAGENFDILKGRSLFIDQKKLKTNLPQPVALWNKIDPGSPVEEADIEVFKRWEIALIFPVKSTTDEFLGFLVLGERKSGNRFAIEDLDLLIEVCLQAGLTIERIQIQERLIREQLLKEKLQELNDLKSFFLSSVSHELKTPLTSIKMFTEFLHLNENIEQGKKEEYLEIIEGECDRLGRLIENLLDLSKIERGVIEFHFSEINIKSLLNHAVALMSYQAKIENCEIITKICEDECELKGDVDLIQSAIINLLSNGIKYSSNPKKVLVRLEKNTNSINISFQNSGACLSQDDLLKITEPYYRSENVKKQKISGSGIGLALVNQVMEIHKGKLVVNNLPEIGCEFTLLFPQENCHEKNISS